MRGMAPPRFARALAMVLALLAAPRPGPAQDLLADDATPVVLTADELTYDQERRVVIATGNVELSRGDRRLLADLVRYDEAADKAYARGNIVLIEPGGDAVFGDEMEITGDLREGFVEGIRALLADDSRLAGNRATRREGNITEVDKAVYSPCPLCQDGKGQPLWQIRARKVIHDQQERTLTYRDAVLEFFGVPVAYTPYFSHPDPTVDRRSGFLAPHFGSDSELGLTLRTPYFWTLGPNRDVTFAPLFTTSAGVVLAGEVRDLETFGLTTLGGSITQTEKAADNGTTQGGKELRGNLEGSGRYDLSERDRAGFDLDWASDKTYLRRYNISNANILENRAYLERIEELDYYGLTALAFQGLREEDKQELIPFALPFAQTRLRSGRWNWGSHWSLDASALALTRTNGRDVQRLSGQLGWDLPWMGPIGDVWNLRLSMRSDLYNTVGTDTEVDPNGSGNETGTAARLLPRATLDWGFPLIGGLGSWQHTVEPVASLNLAPSGGNSDRIPNEDSLEFEFDETNLLEPIRFTGLDRNEGGSKLAYGVRFGAYGPGVWSINGIVGQSLNFTDEDEFPANSGLNGRFSDYVGRVEVRPADFLDVAYRFRIEKENLDFARSDLTLGVGPPRLRASLKYLKLDSEGLDPDPQDAREELIAGVRVQLLDSLAVAAQTRRDLNQHTIVTNTYGLVYTHPCLILIAGLQQDFTEQGELNRPITFTVRVALKNLGQVGTGGGLFGF
jgi:LPS-assembly protein